MCVGVSSIMFCCVFFFKDTATTEIYTVGNTLSLHDALPIYESRHPRRTPLLGGRHVDAVHRSEEHTSELQSLPTISYAVFCLKKKQQHRAYGEPHGDFSTTRRRPGEQNAVYVRSGNN